MSKTIKLLEQDLARAGYVAGTRKSYLAAARGLEEHAGKPISRITREEVRKYVDAVMARPVGGGGKRTRLQGLLFLYRRTLGKPEMVSFIKLPKVCSKLPTVLGKGEVKRLLDGIRDMRCQAVAMVMYGTGLRISEALTLEVTDIDAPRNVVRVRYGKGGKEREAKLSPVLYVWLRWYWGQTRPPLPYLFANSRGRLPTYSTVRRAVAKAAKEVGIRKSVSPHVLRHSFATHLLEEGADIRVISALLGHASIRATTRYARVTEKLVRQMPSPLELLPR